MQHSTAGSDSHWAANRSVHGGVDEIPLPTDTPGRLWLCGKQFIGPDPEAAMAFVNATAVVCLNERSELDRYPGYQEWLAAQPPDRLCWWPVPDLYVPDTKTALELFDELAARLADGQTLLMHCGAGIGRAGTIAAGLLITLGSSGSEAVAHVRASRPMAGPEAGPQTEFLHWLSEIAERRRGQLTECGTDDSASSGL